MEPASNTSKRFSIEVAQDRLCVKVRAVAGAHFGAAEVIADLQALGLKKIDEGALIQALETRGTSPLELEVARGVAPLDERYGKLDLRVPVAQGGGVAITRVEAGQLLAKLGPKVSGTPGRDVFGTAVDPKPAALPFALGTNVKSVKGEVIAGARGNLRLANGTLSIGQLLEISAEDETNVKFDGDVHIKGGLRDGRSVDVTGSLLVGGAVEAAEVNANGSIQIKGGIIGKGRGRCSTNGDLWCRFIASSNVVAVGDVHVQGGATNGQIICGKMADVARGPICGGRVIANGGITCLVAGNESSVPTILEVGAEVAFAALSAGTPAQIELSRRRAREVREKIEPLMKMLKHLTHQQREKATELLAEASESEERADELAAKLITQAKALRDSERLEVVVLDVAHAGVRVRIGSLETVLKTALKGPFTLTTAKIGASSSIVLVDTQSGTRTPLPSHLAKTSETDIAAIKVVRAAA